MGSPDVGTTAAELSAAAEAIASYQRRVGDLALPHLGTERDDLVTAIYEAERSLRTAERLLQRAVKLASQPEPSERELRRKAATAPGGRGRRSGDARRRIPAVAANQVAGTWLVAHIIPLSWREAS